MTNCPASRPDLWNKFADSEALGQHYLRAIGLLTERGVIAKSEVAIVIALHAQHIERLESQKWDVQHTDTMNDMVALGIDRDSWKARVETLEARQVKLEAVVEAAKAVDRMEDLSASRLRKALAALGDGDG